MLTRLTIRNFKSFEDVDIELGPVSLFIGPNNAGKTSALQAVALWELGLRRWTEKRSGGSTPERRPGVAINRRDLLAVPVPRARLLWSDLRVRDVRQTMDGQRTANVRIDVLVEGVTDGAAWKCGLEFDYANEESFYVRPLRLPDGGRMPIPAAATHVRVALLPPMSGLTAQETLLPPGAVDVRIGEGRTAEVLRNLCHELSTSEPERWREVQSGILELFGVTLHSPTFVPERGEITMTYGTSGGVELDLASAGRGLQQTLLLLSYMAVHPNHVLLLDEPDASLEILRQRQVYDLLVQSASAGDSQVLAASHSEVLLNEAADRDVVVAFVGTPHRIDDRGSHVLKWLKEIGYEHLYQAEQTGWVLYLEGSTDLAILKEFARILRHPAGARLERPYVHYVGNQRSSAKHHFFGLREAKPDLVGFLLTDRLDREKGRSHADLAEHQWRRREIENYLCQPEALIAWAVAEGEGRAPGPLFEGTEASRWGQTMAECIEDRVPPVALRDRNDRFWTDVKATDDFLDPLFEEFFRGLELPNLLRKTDYHRLARHVPSEALDSDIATVLDAVVAVAARANPVR